MSHYLIPQPLQVVVDDVGWWSGEDGSARGEPFRTSMPRPHAVADYQALIDLGRRTGTRPLAAFMLGEWDRWNWLRALPSATWQGAGWNNARWSGPWLDEAADLLRREAAHVELALHGLCHEFWHWDGPLKGACSRAEWFTKESAMRPRDEVLRHLDLYYKLWDAHQLGPHPRTFVPCAFLYRTGLGPDGMGPLLSRAGISAISTPFNRLGRDSSPPRAPFFYDDSMLMLDRSQNDIPWRQVGPSADYTIRGPTLGLHWPQLLHEDPARNGEAVDEWVRLLQRAGDQPAFMLAPDSQRYIEQVLHHAVTTIACSGASVTLDARAYFALPGRGKQTTVFLKRADASGPKGISPVSLTESEPVRTITPIIGSP